MKPRLEPALPTKEDIDILCYTWPGRDWRRDPLYPIGHSISADRRDADLMLRAQVERKILGWQRIWVCAEKTGPVLLCGGRQ